MGYDVNRFEGEVDEDLTCSICSDVLEEPLHAPKCEHAFCKSCINEWLARQPYCPVDRQPITTNELKPASRILRNFLSRLMIKCDYANFGCSTVVKLEHLERLEAHKEDCEHNPKRPLPCEQGCGLTAPKGELKDHNCIREVRLLLQTQQDRVNEMQHTFNEMQHASKEMQHSIKEMRRDIVWIRCCMQECIHAIQQFKPSLLATVDDTMKWANSLQWARIMDWQRLISTPDLSLLGRVQRALTASGCPPHSAVALTKNAHQRRWPAGLRSLETRQSNRQYSAEYLCKRIPGEQAIVIMAGDNGHMNEDMILEPGLVMIFGSGIL